MTSDSRQDPLNTSRRRSNTARQGTKQGQPHSKSTTERFRRNREALYPPEIRLKKPGPERKLYLNTRHKDQQARIDRHLQSGATDDVAREELALARSIIPRERFLEEPDLMGLTFVPYRYRSAWQRTEHFAQEFDSIYREYQLSHFAESIPAPSRDRLSLWPDSDINALWRARQHADYLGVPYRFFIRQAFKYRFATGYKRCPKPGQLWHGEKILDFIETEFKKHGGTAASREYSVASLHPMFLVENYRGDPVQRAAHVDLRTKAKQFPDFFKLGHMLMASRIMPEDVAREQFGDAQVDRVIEVYKPYSVRADSVAIGEDQVPMLGCFGNYEASAIDCPTCPLRSKCQVMQTEVDALLLAEHGSTNPVGAAATSAATLRKRRQRERDRLDREADPVRISGKVAVDRVVSGENPKEVP